MNDQFSFGRFTVFHERHFRFAQVFMDAVLANSACKVRLMRDRSLPKEPKLTLGMGGFGSNQGGGMHITLGADALIPLSDSRRLNLEAGLHAQYLSTPSDKRDAFLFGVRLGLSARTNPTKVGVGVGVFAGGGTTLLPSRRLRRSRGQAGHNRAWRPRRSNRPGARRRARPHLRQRSGQPSLRPPGPQLRL